MTIHLLANVGNSDLLVESLSRNIPSRELGERVKQEYPSLKDQIELPLIDPAINKICSEQRCKPKDIHVVLFTTNQSEIYAEKDERAKDTYPVAEAIQMHLSERKADIAIPKAQVRLKVIDGNPADYLNALDFHRRTLSEYAKSRVAPDDAVYFEISGGTPAMTAMLLIMGVEVFGPRAKALYIDRGVTRAKQVPVAEALFANKMREVLEQQIKLYAYSTARETLKNNSKLITPDEQQRSLLDRLLGYGDRRLAFDFVRAADELDQAQTTGELQAQINFWESELRTGSPQRKIEEVIHSAKIKAEQGEFANLTSRLFRFQESLFRYMAEKMGLEYGSSDQFLSQTWVNNTSGLSDYLADYRRNAKGKIIPSSQPSFSIESTRTLNRTILGAIVDFFVLHPTWSHWQDTADRIFQLSSVAELRNKGIDGHGFAGVSKEDVEKAYGANIDELLKDLNIIYLEVFRTEPAASPYDTLNTVLLHQLGRT